MPNITFIDAEGVARTVEAEVGSNVMEAALKNGIPGIEAECGGACACATCHVYVDDAWTEKVGGPSPMEEDMLDFGYDVRPNSRLSCQIKVTKDLDGLVVRTPDRQTSRVVRRSGRRVAEGNRAKSQIKFGLSPVPAPPARTRASGRRVRRRTAAACAS